MSLIPMCRWCGEFEAGMFAGGTDEFCSVDCIDVFDSTSSGAVDYTDGEAMMAQFDDDSSPYAGTYSED